jgi:hypothetical protein
MGEGKAVRLKTVGLFGGLKPDRAGGQDVSWGRKAVAFGL